MALTSFEQDRLRLAAFAGLERLIDSRGGFATRDELLNFELEGRRFPLIDYSRGIRNPADFDETLSVVSANNGPYSDHIGDDGILRYSFREGDPVGGDNRKLRAALISKKPLILFQKPLPNVYVPVVPSFVVDEDVEHRFFLIASGEESWRSFTSGTADPEIDKRYVAQIVQRRVHQPVFRARVILAYSRTCAVCRLNHPELLDAAHIIADRDSGGIAHVTNGLALCKIHHAAFDNRILGISPDYIVHIDGGVLKEIDGPMLKHGIQEMEGISLTLPPKPADWPSREALAARFDQFTA
ncbi:MAG: restriction endonuclease [Acidobacteria bacterium]|nr:restriction endonuclease [Acidobacteriota bacterium]